MRCTYDENKDEFVLRFTSLDMIDNPFASSLVPFMITAYMTEYIKVIREEISLAELLFSEKEKKE